MRPLSIHHQLASAVQDVEFGFGRHLVQRLLIDDMHENLAWVDSFEFGQVRLD
jgi:hypothetical protein